MRNKIDYGIDLGTTNSAIARMENGEQVIKKSDTLKDTIPSCINFNKKKDVIVGDTAFNVMRNDSSRALKTFDKGKTNTYIEFKRTMGTTTTYDSTNMAHAYTSEELSSEILKKLKSLIQDENISSIVITIPAKFQYPQKEATMQAARLAGFNQVELLQEPVAAATAYGLGNSSKDGFWLVFDFGGGTFDAALVKSEEGILSVKDTEGDNWLGGKNLDEAIVDQIILPYLQKHYAIDFVLDDPDKRQMLRAAVKFYAEEAKNQMSFKDKYTILTNLGDLPFEDENGEEPEIDVEITTSDMEHVLGPIFQKAINITKDLLKRNHLKGSDIESLILVGGPTHSPVLRKMLQEQITEKVDVSVDPMTVVAKGAALFASTVSVSDEIQDATRDMAKLQLDVKYEATSVDTDTLINIKVLKAKSSGSFPDILFAEVVRSDGAWSSGKKPIGERAALVELLLIEGRSNSFDIRVYDNGGNRLDCEPNSFNILQGIGGLDGMQILPYNIGIGKYYENEEKDLFYPIKGLEKNKRIPAVGVVNGLKTRSTVRPGMAKDIIRIPVYEGNYNAEGTNPTLNDLVNEVIITGESFPALLPEGSDVNLTIKVDRSGIWHLSAEFPLLEYTEEVDIDIKKKEAPTDTWLQKEIAQAKRTAREVRADEVENRLIALEDQLENEKGNADGKLKLLDSLRNELLILDGAQKTTEWPKIEQELKNSFYEFEKLITQIKKDKNASEKLKMDKVESQLQEFKQKIEIIIREKAIREAKQLSIEISQLDFEIRNIVTENAMDVQLLQEINSTFNSFHWKDAAKARQLVNQGMQFVVNGKTSEIRLILAQIVQLMPLDEQQTVTLK